MKQIETEIRIKAPVSKVWQVLIDFKNHPSWNPFIQTISGDKKEGGKLTVVIRPPDGKRMTFRPKVLRFEPNKEFRWKGSLGVKGIFDGEHYFILDEISTNETRFVHGENFSGILTGMMGSAFEKTRKGFELMNKALKKKCEQS